MSWSMWLVWPEIYPGTDEYDDDEALNNQSPLLSPEWAVWRAAMDGESALQERIRRAGCGALLAYCTEGTEPDQIEWVSPNDLASASSALKELILRTPDDPLALEILRLYVDYSSRDMPLREAFCDDLDDIAKTALWAASLGHDRVILDLEY